MFVLQEVYDVGIRDCWRDRARQRRRGGADTDPGHPEDLGASGLASCRRAARRQGRRDMEISALTGYSPGRIAALHRDPSFQELVAFYKREEDALNQDFMDRMGVVARDLLQSVHDDILDLPYLPFKDKVEAFKVVTDRAGYAPVQRSISKSMNYTIAERMDAARKRKDDAA
jgi:hypothetical protein